MEKGIQYVTDAGGNRTAVILPIEQWRRLQQASRPSLKALLLSAGPRFENLLGRRPYQRHPPVEFR